MKKIYQDLLMKKKLVYLNQIHLTFSVRCGFQPMICHSHMLFGEQKWNINICFSFKFRLWFVFSSKSGVDVTIGSLYYLSLVAGWERSTSFQLEFKRSHTGLLKNTWNKENLFFPAQFIIQKSCYGNVNVGFILTECYRQ